MLCIKKSSYHQNIISNIFLAQKIIIPNITTKRSNNYQEDGVLRQKKKSRKWCVFSVEKKTFNKMELTTDLKKKMHNYCR